MKRIAALIVSLAMVLSIALGSVSATHASPGPARVSGTLMIGDSTTKRVHDEVMSRHPDWFVDGVGGRSVKALPARLEAYLANHPAPARFVMALGTNRGEGWSYDRLERAIDKLPARTKVYIIKVVRAGKFQADKDRVRNQYNGYSRQLINNRPNTYFVPWRDVVLNDPTLNPRTGVSSLLEDGTHQTGSRYGSQTPGPGVVTYVNLIDREMAKH